MKLLWKKSGGSNRVVRGGSWAYDGRYLRASVRNGDDPGDRHDDLGFRCVRNEECTCGSSGQPRRYHVHPGQYGKDVHDLDVDAIGERE